MASLLVGFSWAAQAEGGAGVRRGARPIAGWRVTLPEISGPGASAVLRGRVKGSPPRPAFLAIRCVAPRKLAVDAVIAQAGAVVGYRLENGRLEPHARAAVKRLGGSRMLREIPHGDLLTIDIDDVELGLARLHFRLAGTREAVRQVAEACTGTTVPSRAAAASLRPARGRSAARKPPAGNEAHSSRTPDASVPPPAAPRQVTDTQEPPPAEADRATSAIIPRPSSGDALGSKPLPSSPPPDAGQAPAPPRGIARSEPLPDHVPPSGPDSVQPAPPQTPGPPAGESSAASPALPRDEDKAPGPSPSEPVSPAPPQIAAAVTPTPPPGPVAPPAHDPGSRRERLAAFVQRYGPNRHRELMYDWYRQCLDLAGIARERVWYLSGEQLTYLTKGETDEVRVSLLVSTDPNLDVPPRRIACYGSGKGRDLTLTRAETLP
jgi:hypothetical protein